MGQKVDESSSYMRVAHMEGLLRNPKFTKQFDTIEEAWKGAAHRVRMAHPDPGALTNFEGKYLKQAIPFYTWQRSIIAPTLLSMIATPRNMLLFPRLYQALNDIAGSDQGDPGGLGNQWDPSVRHPNYITANPLGAAGNIGGLARAFIGGGSGNPGADAVGMDLNSAYENAFGATGLFSGVGAQSTNNGFGGMLAAIPGKVMEQASPLIQLPLSIFNSQLTNRGVTPIKDTSDYIDQMLPFVNQISNMSGYSPSGTLGNLLTANPALDKQASVVAGSKLPWRNIALLNSILPVKLSDPNNVLLQRAAFSQMMAEYGVPNKKHK